jgi:hypothetical protein
MGNGRAGETSSIRALKSMMDDSDSAPRRARRDAASYYEHASTQIIDTPVKTPTRLTKLVWRIEQWIETRGMEKETREKQKALRRLNSK